MTTRKTNKPGAEKKRKVQRSYREARRLESLKVILDDPLPCRYLWELLEKMMPLGDSRAYDPKGFDPYATAANAAVQALGVSIMEDIINIEPEAFLRYLEERKNLSKEEEGLQDDETS